MQQLRNKVLMAVVVMTAVNAQAAQIFYEDFEDPVVSGTVTASPTGWVSVTGADAGLSDATTSGKTGDQYGWVYRDGGTLLLSDVGHTLGAGTNYILTCDLTFSRSEATYATAALLAGGNIIAISTNVCISANDFAAQSISLSFVALPGHPHVGKALGIRLSGDYWDAYFDELSLDATTTTNDMTPPTPTNMVWNALPTSSISNSITMQAVGVVDTNTVQYYFLNTVNGTNSGWQESPFWSDTGLTPQQTYSYKFKARDKSVNLNETGWSTEESALCEEHIVVYASFEMPSIMTNTYIAFDDPKWFLPPDGWAGGGASSRAVIHDTSPLWPVETPYGEQWVGVRDGTYIETTSALSNYVFEAGYTYRVSYHTGCAGERVGEENGVPGDSRVELIAGSTVVASNTVSVTLDDFSETNGLEFVALTAHTNLGEPLKIRLSASSTGNWWYHVLFDNVKVYAIPPPPSGTVITLY